MTVLHFQHSQRQFLNYLRQPSRLNQPSGLAKHRLDIYAELVYNNFEENLSSCFPVIKSILADAQWSALVSDFLAEHRCLTPYYRQVPDEFVLYLQTERQVATDPGFLAELAHFEWIELVLSIAEAENFSVESLSNEQLLDSRLVFAPVTRLLHYQWPVQLINTNFQPLEAPETATHILGFRTGEDVVQFINLNPATAELIRRLQNQCKASLVLSEMGSALAPTEQENLRKFGLDILIDLHRQQAIIGIDPKE